MFFHNYVFFTLLPFFSVNNSAAKVQNMAGGGAMSFQQL